MCDFRKKHLLDKLFYNVSLKRQQAVPWSRVRAQDSAFGDRGFKFSCNFHVPKRCWNTGMEPERNESKLEGTCITINETYQYSSWAIQERKKKQSFV